MAISAKPPAGRRRATLRRRRTLTARSRASPIRELYTAADLPAGRSAAPRIRSDGPASTPTRAGIHDSMYRGRLWTMRQFAGFGTSEETNERFHYLLEHGQTGLSTAFDMPSLMGHDSDHARSLGEVGPRGRRGGHARRHADAVLRHRPRRGVGVDDDQRARRDHARLLRRRRRVRSRSSPRLPERLSGTIQADILKEYIAQKEWCFPIDPAMRLCGDMIEWCTRRMPRWHPISISGYHIREAGSTAQQELAFTLKDGLTYVEQAVAARPGRRRLRAAAVVLLQRPDRLLRGDRQVPRRAAHLGQGDARDLRRARTRAPGRCASTPRPPASASPPSSRSTTSSAPPSRRSPPCSAAPSRCTPTPTTRRSRCPPRRPSRSRCAPSR